MVVVDTPDGCLHMKITLQKIILQASTYLIMLVYRCLLTEASVIRKYT